MISEFAKIEKGKKETKDNISPFLGPFSKFYLKRNFQSPEEIESLDKEKLVALTREELKEIQETIRKCIEEGVDFNKEASGGCPYFPAWSDFLNIDVEKIGPSEAEIWQKFKLVETENDLALFEGLIFRPVQRKLKEKMPQKVREAISSQLKELVSMYQVADSEEELESIKRKIRELVNRHSSNYYSQFISLMGNLIVAKLAELRLKENKQKDKNHEI